VLPDEVAPDEVASPEASELGVGETDAEGLTLTDLDTAGVGLGLAFADGVAVAGQVPVAVAAFLLPVALVLAFAEADLVAVLVAVALSVAVAVAVTVAVAVPVAVAVAVPLSPGLAVLLAVLLPPLGGLTTGLAEGTLGVTGLAGLAAADGEADGHAGAVRLLWAAEVRPRLAPPPDEPSLVPDPARLGAPPPVLEEEIPTAVLSWTKASRSGGSARATPMANTAHAAARAGRSSPYRQSRGCRARRLPASWPPCTAFQRRIRSARKPLRAEAPECWPA
jgi:hypothetical protein